MNQSCPMLILSFMFSCNFQNEQIIPETDDTTLIAPQSVKEIFLPASYKRVDVDESSFSHWLRSVKLKKDKLVYLYDGKLKRIQSWQFAVLDIPIGDKNLQQCADAVMRLRAEYLYAERKYDEISFSDNDNKVYKWTGKDDRPAFERYLETVFGWCGSASLEKQMKPANISEIEPGHVFIKGGFPGHAMIVMDVAINEKGERIYLLGQGFMPAQDIHIVKNPIDPELSPWYKATEGGALITPAWTFYKDQLKNW